MADNTVLEQIKQEIAKLEDKTFNIYFYVFDSKGTPSGTLSYIYKTALILKDMGYKVTMLHTEKEFVGVGAWMGEEFAALPHANINSGSVSVSPSDFLFIPELNTNVMSQTKGLACKRVAILTNFGYMTDVIPVGASWDSLEIRDCVAATNVLKDRLNTCFPNVRANVVRPYVDDVFCEGKEPKKLIVNIVSKNSADVNSVIKPIYWKVAPYSFIAMREIRNLPKEELANAFKEAAITVWLDTPTDFGVTALEAMACKNVLIAKVPDNAPDWATEDGKLRDNAIWFYNIDDVHKIIADAIQTVIQDEIPEVLWKNMATTVEDYRKDKMVKDVEDVYVKTLFENRIKELKFLHAGIVNNEAETKSE